MTLAKQTTRILPLMLTLALLLAPAPGAKAQETAQAPAGEAVTTSEAGAPPEMTPPPSDAIPQTSQDVRREFASILRLHPTELATILALDPTLLSNDAFLTGYPKLAAFVSAHPEVRRNPRFYLEDFSYMPQRRGMLGEILEGLFVFSIFLLISFMFVWLVRTIIEQKRWNRLSRTQSEVHTKILDRFGTSAELLEYIRTPAGTKFLESAPIPLHAEQAPTNATLSRSLASIQVGIVVAAGALGMLLVSGRLDKEASEGMFAMGAIGACIGAGFIVSAIISIVLSRRLGLWSAPAAPPANALDDSAAVR